MALVDPHHTADPEFPDPDLIDALGDAWLQMAEDLNALSSIVGESLNGVNWTGDGRNAAMIAAAAVGNVIATTSANARHLGEALKQYASQVPRSSVSSCRSPRSGSAVRSANSRRSFSTRSANSASPSTRSRSPSGH
jgi:hypothetical protein